MLQHPSSRAIFKIIYALASVLEEANKPGAFNIAEPRVSYYYGDKDRAPCHCVAGWASVAIYTREIIASGVTGNIHYGDGKRIIDKFLDFGETYRQKYLAEETDSQVAMVGNLGLYLDKNPHLWGNEHGRYLYHAPEAYDGLANHPAGAEGAMSYVIAQWLVFWGNVREMEISYLRRPYITVVW